MASKLDMNETDFGCSNCQLNLLMQQLRDVSRTLSKLNEVVIAKTESFNLLKLHGILSKVNFNCKKIKDQHFFLHESSCNPAKEEMETNKAIFPCTSKTEVSNDLTDNGIFKDIFTEKRNEETIITNFKDFKNLSVLSEEEHAIALLVQKEFDKINIQKRETEKDKRPRNNSMANDDEADMECPICLDVPEKPPVYKCANGHILCNNCRHAITSNKCPVCNIDLSEDRCFITELYITNRPKKCKYQSYGCRTLEKDSIKLSEHEKSCSKAPSEVEKRKEREKNDLMLQKRKDIELAIEVTEEIQDDIKAQEVQDEGLALAIQSSQEDEIKKLAIEQQDHQFCLMLEKDDIRELENIEKLKREQEASDLEYARSLQKEMDLDQN